MLSGHSSSAWINGIKGAGSLCGSVRSPVILFVFKELSGIPVDGKSSSLVDWAI